MLIVDDILLFPVRGLFWVFREIHKAVEQELANQRETTIAELTELYMMLETKQITEEEFNNRERELLDRLEKIQQTKDGEGEKQEDTEEEKQEDSEKEEDI